MCCLLISENGVTEDKTSLLNKYNEINDNEIVDEVLQYIKKGYMIDISLDYVASRVHVSPIYLSRLIKNKLNSPYIKVLNEYRLGKAAWYLGTTNKKISEISNMVGINDARYFGFLFKKAFGATPLEYRNTVKRYI